MPLRDHLHRPDGRPPNWDEVHGFWPGELIRSLRGRLPSGFRATLFIHIAGRELDLAALENENVSGTGGGGTATLTQLAPSLTLDIDPPDVDEYSLRVYEANTGERLVASVEFVSPRNKDRPESRRMFVAKCVGLLNQGVCVSIVDCVTAHHFNLYADLLDFLGHSDPAMAGPPVPHLYAVTLRRREEFPRWRLDLWAHRLAVGGPLPSLPVWLTDTVHVTLELEPTYLETCETLQLPE
jgi:Protein of unknown function (DUF4058)